MQARTKVVELAGSRFELRKLPPEVGSFIFMRMLGISMRSEQEAQAVRPARKQKSKPQPQPELEDKTTGEMRVRALAFSVCSGAIGFDDFKFIQNACMQVVSRYVERAGQSFPVPIMADNGEWTEDGDVVVDSVGLMMQLMTEVLVFCFSSFFDDGVPGM